MKKEIPWERRCKTFFEARTPGKRYVNRRWQCPRAALKGLSVCSYCETIPEKEKRRAAQLPQGGSSNVD